MAKTGKYFQQFKEQQFDELIQNNLYFNEVYTYLLKYESEFSNLSLIDFILNCDSASVNILIALINENNNKELTIKYIIEQRGYYETALKPDYLTNYKLNDFELYLTKFIVAHCLIKRYKEDKKRTDYFNQILSITASQKNNFKYFFDYYRGYFCSGNDWGVCADWHLKLNTKQYVIIDKKELAEILNKLKPTTTQPTPPQKEIEPINFTGITKRDLPYFFWQLERLKLIENKNLGLTLSKLFTYNNVPIDNTYFNAEFGKFKKGELPTNATDIDKILMKPKKVIVKMP